MIAGRIFRLLPLRFRRRSVWIVASIVLGALLDLAGIATLFPLLILLAKPEALEGDATFLKVFTALGFTDMRTFTVVLGFVAVALLAAKNLAAAWLAHSRTRYLTELYNYFSDRLFISYYNRGLLFIRRRHISDLTMAVGGQCHSFVWGLLRPMLSLLGGAIVMAAMLAIFIAVSPRATLLLALCLAPVVWLYFAAMRRPMERRGEEDFRSRREQMRSVQQSFRAYPEIEIAGAFDTVLGRFRANLAKISRNRLRMESLGRLPVGIMEVGVTLCIALLIVARPENLLSTLTLLGVAAIRLLPTMRQMMSDWSGMKQNRHTLEAIAEDFEPDELSSELPVIFEREIVFNNVSFSYDGSRDILDRTTLTIRKGDRLAIRGVSGAGKSTLLNVLLGFFPPVSGRVTIDGSPLDRSTAASWHAQTGYVPQEVYLPEGTLAENIALGAAAVDRERVVRVIGQVRLTGRMAAMDKGIDTLLGENGCRLSAGERQRVGIARALYKGAETLILDEATSALDRQTEQSIGEVLEALAAQNPRLTIVAVSHRELPFCTREITLDA